MLHAVEVHAELAQLSVENVKEAHGDGLLAKIRSSGLKEAHAHFDAARSAGDEDELSKHKATILKVGSTKNASSHCLCLCFRLLKTGAFLRPRSSR